MFTFYDFGRFYYLELGTMQSKFDWERVRLLWECLRFLEAQTVLKNPWLASCLAVQGRTTSHCLSLNIKVNEVI